MEVIRKPAVSGLFYPDDKEILNLMIKNFLNEAPLFNIVPKGLIVPHAGYIYSGITASFSYKQLLNLEKDRHYNILLIGPSHFVHFRGISFGYYDYWQTPLGKVSINKNLIDTLILNFPDLPITVDTLPHLKEHSLEVQIPFIQMVLNNFSIIPVVYGDIDFISLKEIIEFAYSHSDNLITVISTDLSHYYPHSIANQIDKNCILGVENLDLSYFDKCEACGMIGLKAIVYFAKENKLKSKVLDYRTSGDTSGDKEAVVGYLSGIFF